MWREFYRYLTRHVQPLRPAAGRAGLTAAWARGSC